MAGRETLPARLHGTGGGDQVGGLGPSPDRSQNAGVATSARSADRVRIRAELPYVAGDRPDGQCA